MTRRPTTHDEENSEEILQGSVRSRAWTHRLSAAYREMAADRDREVEAQEWLDAVAAPLDEEPDSDQ